MTFILIFLTFGSGFLLVFGFNMMIADRMHAHRVEVRERLEGEDRVRQKQRSRSMIARKDRYKANEETGEAAAQLTLWGRFSKMVNESGITLQPSQVALICLGCSLFVGGFIFLIWHRWAFAVLAAPAAALLPIMYVSQVRTKRLAKLLSQLPEAFDLMSRSMRAGQTIIQTMQSVAEDFSSPIADEFGYCCDQQNLGLSPEVAMHGLAARTGLLEIKIFVLAVMVHRQTGGNLSELLDKLSGVIRDRYRIRGSIKSLTAEGRAQVMVLLLLPPLVFGAMLVINQSYATALFDYPQLMIGTVTAMILGAFWMNRIVNFDFQPLAAALRRRITTMFALQLHFDAMTTVWFALAIGTLVALVRVASKPNADSLQRRLATLSDKGEPTATKDSSGQARRQRGGASEPAANRRGKVPEPSGGLRERMLQAGIYGPTTLISFNILRVVLLCAPVAGGYWLSKFGLFTSSKGLLFGSIVGMAATLMPGLWLDRLKRIRQLKIRRALPDALDVISVCLQGGLSLSVALSHVARELNLAHPALAAELNIMERQIQMGRTAGDAIREMANRFDLDELRSMASVINQAERIGASVATALEMFADDMRIRRHQRAEELAHKAAVKLLFPTLLFIFPAVFIVILGPAVIRIYFQLILSMG